jgi:hypothetical protein
MNDTKDLKLDRAGSEAGEHQMLADELAEETGLSRLVLVQSDEKIGDSLLAIKRSLIPLGTSTRWWLRGDSNVTIQFKLALLKVNVVGGPATNVVSKLKQHAGRRLKYCLVLAVVSAVLFHSPVSGNAKIFESVQNTAEKSYSAKYPPAIDGGPAVFSDMLQHDWNVNSMRSGFQTTRKML